LLVVALALPMLGCWHPVSIDELCQTTVAQKRQVADLISSGASQTQIDSEREKLDKLSTELETRRRNMSKVKWNKVWVKYRKEDAELNDLIDPPENEDGQAKDAN